VPDLDLAEYPREFRPDIQALRALAVALVVLYHADIPGAHGGFLGVDVFFVISGFVITNVLLRETASTGRTSISSFYSRRIRRILPAATVVIVATVFATYHWLAFIAGAESANLAKWVVAFMGNFHLASIGTNYFTQSQPPSTLQQFWSLAVEEQFYVVWPIVFLALTWNRWNFSGRTRSTIVATAAAIVVGASLLWCLIEMNHFSTNTFLSPLHRYWELVLGALLVAVGYGLFSRMKRIGVLVQVAGAIAILVWLFVIEKQYDAVFPILFIAATWPLWRQSPRLRLVIALIIIIGASLTWCIIETNQNAVWAFFSPLTRAWELALGATLAVIGPWLRAKANIVGLLMQVIGVCAIVACTWIYTSATVWPGTAVIAPVVATGVVIAGGSLRGPDKFGFFARLPLLQWTGDCSYSLYLVHWPVIAIATQYVTSPLPLLSEIGLVAISIGLAAVLHYVVENPVRNWKWLARQRIVTFAMGVVLIGLTYGVIYWHLFNYGQ
jgi:peptidoglycan/LPS O-acetylase OafA/YrhL